MCVLNFTKTFGKGYREHTEANQGSESIRKYKRQHKKFN